MVPTLEPHNSVTDIPESARTSTPGPRQLMLSRGQVPQGRATESPEGGATASPRPGWCHTEGIAPPKKDGVCGLGEELSTEILAAVPLALSPELQTPVSAHMTLVCSALPPLEPTESSC